MAMKHVLVWVNSLSKQNLSHSQPQAPQLVDNLQTNAGSARLHGMMVDRIFGVPGISEHDDL